MATENELKTLSRRKQSPIELRDDIAKAIHLPPLTLIGHWLNDGKAILSNTGACLTVQLKGERIPSVVKCGPLRDEYEFHSAQFHWGEDDCCGSEHTINGAWFSMEAHAVHWNRKYRTFDECLKHEDGLCILAYLFLVRDNNDDYKISTTLEKITDNLKHVTKVNSTRKIAADSLRWMRKAVNCDSYYLYRGSYNMADNPECAIWLVFPRPLPIRADQMAEFRKLENERGKRIVDNRRETQRLNDRKIYKVVPQ